MSASTTSYGDISSTSGSTSGTADQAKEKAQEVTQQVKEKVGPQVQDLRGRLREQARTQAQQRSDQAAEQARGLADSARSVADDLDQKGNSAAANVARMVGQRGEQVADYLGNSDGDKILRDLETQARQNPWAVAAGAFVVGLVASRLLKASSQRRHDERSRSLGYGSTRPALPPSTETYGSSTYGTGTYSTAGVESSSYSTGTSALAGATYDTGTRPADGSLDIVTGTTADADDIPDAPRRGAL